MYKEVERKKAFDIEKKTRIIERDKASQVSIDYVFKLAGAFGLKPF